MSSMSHLAEVVGVIQPLAFPSHAPQTQIPRQAQAKPSPPSATTPSARTSPPSNTNPSCAQEDKSPIQVAYERRNRDLDPQFVWRGKDDPRIGPTSSFPPRRSTSRKRSIPKS